LKQHTISSNPSLLIINNDIESILIIKQIFDNQEVIPFFALTAEDGLKIMKKNIIDVAIVDYNLPGLSGIEFLYLIKNEYPETVRIILTKYSNTDVMKEAINRVEVYMYIDKPWKEDELCSIIKQAVKFNRNLKEIKCIREIFNHSLYYLIQIQKMRLITAETNHELNNFITFIQCNIEEGMLQLEKPTQKSEEYFKNALVNLKAMTQLINYFADINKEKSYNSFIDLNQIIKETIDFLRPHNMFKNIEFRTQLMTGLPLFFGDYVQIKQLLINLYQNSGTVMNKGSIETVTQLADDSTIEISIQDNGPGIPLKYFNQIFSPEFSLREKGSGLGLYICKQIAENHKGHITVKSRQEKGTKFIIQLPTNRKGDINNL